MSSVLFELEPLRRFEAWKAVWFFKIGYNRNFVIWQPIMGRAPPHLQIFFVIILSNLPLTRKQAKPNTKIILMNLCYAFGRWWCPGQLKTVHDMCCSCQLGWLIYCNTVLAVAVTPAALASWPVCPICALPFFTQMPSCLPCALPSISSKKKLVIPITTYIFLLKLDSLF